jgi:hypothetical protein
MLLQPSQCSNIRPRYRLPAHKYITLRIDIPRGPPKLDTRHDEPDKPEHEEDEGAEDHDAREELALRDQPEHEGEEEDREGGDGDPVGEVPAERKTSVDDPGWISGFR